MSVVSEFRPVVRRTVSSSAILLVVAAISLVLSYAIIGPQILLALAVLLTIATIAFRRSPGAWALAALLVFTSLGPIGSAPGWKFFVAMAAAHFLHVVGMTFTWLPGGGRVELRVLGRPLRMFLVIQIPAQLLSFLILTMLAGGTGVTALASPVFGLLAAVGFIAVAALIVIPVLRERGQ